MNRTRVVPLVVALLCISAIGISSNTLDSSLSTEPDEAIDPDYDALPIGQGDTVRVFEEIGETEGDGSDEPVEGDTADDEQANADPDENGERDEQGARDGEPEEEAAGGGEGEGEAEGGEAEPEGGNGAGSLGESLAGGTGSQPDEASLLDRLLALLVALLRVLLPVLAVLAVAAVLYRYRDRILSLIRPGPGAAGDGPGATPGDGGPPWPDADPSNAIDRAWLSMVARLDPDRPAVMTTAECAADAIEAGMEPDAVETITNAFEQVRYGGVPVTEERERRARQSRQQLEGGTR